MKPRAWNALPVALLLMLGGCASSAPPVPPSLELPAPPADLRAVRKGDRVYLSWSIPTRTTDQELIRAPGVTRICRSNKAVMNACETPVSAIPPAKAGPPTQASFVDTLPVTSGASPRDEVSYAVEVTNAKARSAGLSNQVRLPSMPAVPPPTSLTADLTGAGVWLTWKCPANVASPPEGVDHRLRIYRRLQGSQQDSRIGDDVPLNCEGEPLIDRGFEWEKTYEYRADIVTVISASGTELQIEGDDTQSVTVVAHDVFPPAVPAGLQAVYSGVGQPSYVDLVWTPDNDADLAGYNIFRSEGGESIKLNPDLVRTPAYRDSAIQSGKKYSYSVTAVDVRGNESRRSERATETVP